MTDSSDARRARELLLKKLMQKEGISSGISAIRPRPPESDPPPLSFAQERLWFLQMLEPDSTAYNLSFTVNFDREMDVEILGRTLNEVARRHEVMRTTYSDEAGRPVQHIAEEGRWPLEFVDLTDAAPEEKDEKARVAAEEVIRTPFSLGAGPPIRALLVRKETARHTLTLSMHHIVIDGWSISLFFEELDTVYEAFKAGEPSPLEELAVQYPDYAVWQREFLQGPEFDRQLGYWRDKLDGMPTLELPLDRPRPLGGSNLASIDGFQLEGPVVTGLRELSRAEGATLFMTVLAVFKVLLHRYSGQTDVVVGAPFASRNRAEIENLLGFFVNTLVLRNDLDGDPTFRELLSRVRASTLQALDHQDLPFERLVEELHPERNLGMNPLVQVLFGFQDRIGEDTDFGGSAGDTVGGMSLEAARMDLEVTVSPRDDTLGVLFTFRTELFDPDTIRRVLDHYQGLLEAVVADPDRPISRLPMMSEEERDQVVTEWNQTDTAYPADATLVSLFEAQVERTPDAPAVRFGDEVLTYSELNQRAETLAQELRRRGTGTDHLVAVYMERSVEMVVALYGTLKAGGAYLPIEPTLPPRRVSTMLEDGNPDVVLTQAALMEGLNEAWPTGLGTIEERGLVLDGWETEAVAVEPVAVEPDDLAYVIFTSGSTGRPKGVMVSHRAICNRLLWMQDEYGLGPRDRVLQKTPFSFDVSVWEFFWPLQVGAELVMATPEGHKDPHYLTEVIRRDGITTMHFVPSMMRIFLGENLSAEDLGLRQVFSSGEALSKELASAFLERFPGTELHNLYGPTEAAVDVTFHRCTGEEAGLDVPIGRPVANTRVYVLDKAMNPVPVGVYGELFLGGVQLARGYLGQPELTAERFVPDPFRAEPQGRLYRTGDVVRFLSDGNLEFKGRSDFQVKIRGNRIECGEIEQALLEDPMVDHAIVVAREEEPGDPRLVGYVVLNQSADVASVEESGEATSDSAEESVASGMDASALDGTPESKVLPKLKGRLAKTLPEYMVPTSFVILDALPLTPSGKLDRKALPAPDPAMRAVETLFVAPRNETEEQLAAIWKEMLKLEQVGIMDNFFDLGGHSLLATQVVSRIRSAFQVEIPLRALFENPTISSLAPEVVQARAEGMDTQELAELLALLEGES